MESLDGGRQGASTSPQVINSSVSLRDTGQFHGCWWLRELTETAQAKSHLI